MMKLFNIQTKAIIRKDIRETLLQKQILLPMIIVPMIFMVLIPVGLLIAAGFADSISNDEISELTKSIGVQLPYSDNAQNLIYVFSNFYLPPIFLLIPLMMSSLIGAGCFVIEKERKTLESLFYCPISTMEIFKAKVLATFLPAYALTLCAFIVLSIILNIGGVVFFQHLIFPNIKWLLIVFLLSPALQFLGLSLIIRTSAKAVSFQEAQQTVGFVVLPIVLVIVGQATGIFVFTELHVLISTVVIVLADFIIFKMIRRKFNYEVLLRQAK